MKGSEMRWNWERKSTCFSQRGDHHPSCEQFVDHILRPVSSLLAGVYVDCWSAEGAEGTLLRLSILISRATVCPAYIRQGTVKTVTGEADIRNEQTDDDLLMGEWWEIDEQTKRFSKLRSVFCTHLHLLSVISS